jgi:imidazolonepropionase-like amidohydrolase
VSEPAISIACRRRNPYAVGPLGVIEPGAYADIILVESDPSQNIRLSMVAEKNIDVRYRDEDTERYVDRLDEPEPVENGPRSCEW